MFLLGCDSANYTVTVKNESSASNVSYVFDGKADNLAANGSKSYTVAAYTQPPSDLSCGATAPLSVRLKVWNDEYIIEDAPFLNLTVINRTSSSITISAGKYIDDGGGNTSITVSAGATEGSGKIYTDSPNFTVSLSGYTVAYSLSGDTMNAYID